MNDPHMQNGWNPDAVAPPGKDAWTRYTMTYHRKSSYVIGRLFFLACLALFVAMLMQF